MDDQGAISSDAAVPSATTSNKRKRETVIAACERCRYRKIKCDGQRPRCSRCAGAQAECAWTVQDGQTRHDAMKTRLDRLEKDHNSMRELIGLLRQTSLSQAEALLVRLRSSDEQDASTFIRSLRAHPNRHSTHVQVSSLSNGHGPSWEPPTSPQTTSPALIRNESHESPGRSIAGLPGRNDIPSEQEFRQAIHYYHRCCGDLFYVGERDLIDSLLDLVFRNTLRRSISSALCRICSIAAVGCQHMGDAVDEKSKASFYRTARDLLDSCVEADPVGAITCCTMLAMYNMPGRASVAMGFVEMSIGLSRRYLLHTACRPPLLSPDQWITGKRAWRTAIFFGTWISASLGHLSVNEWDLPCGTNMGELEYAAQLDVQDQIQIAMIKIAMLKRSILKVDVAHPELTPFTIDMVCRDLSQWYEGLSPCMLLSNLPDEFNPFDVYADIQRTVCNVHLLYLGTMMDLHSRIITEMKPTEPGVEAAGIAGLGLDVLTRESASAAERTARLLGYLLDANEGIYNCWIIVFQAYTAGTLLLHKLTRRRTQPAEPEAWLADNLDGAAKCVRVLEICAQSDAVALGLHNRLNPLLERVCQGTTGRIGSITPDMESLNAELYGMISTPLCQMNSQGTVRPHVNDGLFALPREESGTSLTMSEHSNPQVPYLPCDGG